MTEQEMFGLLVECLPSQLDVITVKLKLNQAFLPGSGEPVASRAAAIMKLVRGRKAAGLTALQAVLEEMFPPEPEPEDAEKEAREKKAAKAPCILILAANPIDTDRLRLDREVKLIKERLDEAEAGRRYRVEAEWAISPVELSKLLLQYEPSIVHFSGHGSPSGEIVLEGADGKAETVPARALVDLFDTLKGTETVVLNACYSGEQAAALAKVVPQVIGMARSIGDDAALRFAGGFYRGLAFGKDYAVAFRLGCNQIDLASLPHPLLPPFTTPADDEVAAPSAAGPAAESAALESRQRTGGSVRVDEKAAPPKDEDAPRLFSLWYGTNRRPVDPADPAQGYSGERDEKVRS